MNTPEHDDWERLFRQRLTDLEAQPPAGALARILAAANPLPAPVANPVSAARMGMGGVAAVLLGIWLMQATQRPQRHSVPDEVARMQTQSVPAETMQINGAERQSTGHRLSKRPSPAESRQERNAATNPVGPSAKADKVRETVNAPDELVSHPESANQLAHSNRIIKPAPQSVKSNRAIKPVIASGFAVNSTQKVYSAVIPHRGFLAPGQAATQRPESESRLNPKMVLANVSANGPESITSGFSEGSARVPAINTGTTKPLVPDLSRGVAIDGLETQRTIQPYTKRILLSETTPETLPTAPAVVRQRPARAWFVAVTPLYTYHQLTPVRTDERYVEQIQTPGPLSGGRAGWRAQIGIEQAINKQFAIRAGLTMSELRQSVQYSSRGASFDSARVEVLDNQTIRLTPLYRRQTEQLANTRQFVGFSTDVIWRPSAARPRLAASGPNQTWQPYLTAGLSAGKYTGSGGVVSGFGQVSAGVERAVWPGWWLRVEPSVQYGWRALTDNPALTTRPYTYGLTIGLRH